MLSDHNRPFSTGYRRVVRQCLGGSRPNLILATAQDYGWEALSPFASSLLATGYSGDVRLFASSLPAGTVDELTARGIHVERVRRARRRWGGHVFAPYTPRTTRFRWHAQPYLTRMVQLVASASPDQRGVAAALVGFLGNVEVARYGWYYRYLVRHGHQYRNVMVSDVRDVLFLAQPFSFDIGDSVWFFLENEELRLRDQTNNRGWLIGAYGEPAFEAIGDRPISCSGLTIGSSEAMLSYLGLMVDHLARLPRQFKGIDQGVHNYLLHNDLVQHARMVPNARGPVLTVGTMSGPAAVELLRSRRSEAKIIHQYDRHPALAAELAGLLGAPSSA
jgi:hypothetical protein